jgi:hypothetical protein
MKVIKYILLYLPWLIISVPAWIYYGIGSYEGAYNNSVNEAIGLGLQGDAITAYVRTDLALLVEICRASHFWGYLPLFILLMIVWRERRTTDDKHKDDFIRFQLSSMLVLLVMPKLVDHLLTIIKVYTNNAAMFDAYTHSKAALYCMLIHFIIIPIRLYLDNKN